MKNFFPLFLGALLSFASFSSLNGQVELIRIQETGNREQAIIREQGTGDREQVKNNRKGVLQSEDQIDQRVGSTTNYELPTKNSNNQGNSLDCYLMMNPAVEGAEEAMELALSETRIPSKVIKSISLGVPASEANSLSSFSASGRTTANVTASSHQNKASSSEEAEISSSSDNQTLKDMLLAEIQSNIEMLGTANVAGKLLEQEEQIKNKLEQDHPNITWDWNSVNLDELIHQALEKKYELAYLASLWTENEVADQALAERREALRNLHSGNNKLSPEEQELENDKKIAESVRDKAKEANITALAAKSEADEKNFSKELKAYNDAKDSWTNATIAYKNVLATASKVDNFDGSALRSALKNAEINVATWSAHIPWVKARQLDQAMEAVTNPLSLKEALDAEAAWNMAIETMNAALAKTLDAGFDSAALFADIRQANERRAAWSDTITELKKPRDAKETEASYLKRLEATRLKHQQAIQKIVLGKNSQHAYAQWELLGELPEHSGFQDVEEPLLLLKELEVRGRELLREARAKHAVINDSEASKLDRSMVEGSEKSSPKNKKQADVLALEQQAKVEIMAESLKPEAKDRLELLVKENQLRQEAVVMAKAAKLLRETQAEENALSTEKDDQGSMISRVTKISGSVLGSIFGGSSTTVKSSSYVVGSTARPRDLETVIAEAGGLEQQWKKLMEEAEKARIEQGGAPLDPSLIMDTWKEADTTVIAAQQEQEKIQKEHAIAARRKEKWSANTARWKARIQADELAVAAQKSEEKAASLFEEELEIKAKLGAKEKEKQDADEQTAVAKKEAASAKTAAFKAEEEWEALAMSHHNMIAAQKEGGTAVQAALDKLRKSDQAVKDLWYNLTSSYAEDEIREQGDEEAEQQRIKKELDDCKIKKIVDETSCFEGVTIARAKAKEAYLKAKTPESKEATKPLYDDVDRLELKAYQDYTERVKNDALESARKRIPGMEAVWIERMTESEKKRETKANAILFKVPCKDAWADENQRDLMHSTAIAAADEEACKTFQNEEKRLADIEALWKAVIEAKKKALITSPKNAAQAYVEGDKSAWLALSAEERQAYNQEISDANEVYTTKAATIIELAEERVAQALREVEKRKYSVRDAIGISNKKQLALEALERAEAGLAIVQAAEKERKKALGWIDQKSREAKIEQLSQNIQQTLKEGLDFDSQTSAAIHAAAQIASQASSHPKLASEFCDDSRMLDFLALMMEQDCMVMEDYLAAVKAYRSLNHQAAAYWIKAAEASCEAANGYMKACATLWGGNKALNRLFFYYTSETTQKNFSELEDAIAQQNEYATLVALQFEMAAKNYSLTAQAILRRESESIISNLLHQAEAEDKKASFMKKAWPVSTNHYLRSRHLSVRSGFVYLDPSFSAYFDLSEDMESKDMD